MAIILFSYFLALSLLPCTDADVVEGDYSIVTAIADNDPTAKRTTYVLLSATVSVATFLL